MKARNDKGVWYKGIFCEVWGGMYDNTSEAFFRGTLPELSRTLKCDDSACVVVEEEVEEMMCDAILIGNIYPSGGQNGNIWDVNGISPTILSGTGVTGRGIGSCNAPKILIY